MPEINANRAATRMTTGFEIVKKTQFLSSNLIVSILSVLFIITGCSDAPHIGSMLTVDDVDRYIASTEDFVCLKDSDCVTLVPEGSNVDADIPDGPIIHIHPNRLIYVFYREGIPVVRAERSVGGGGTDTNGTVGRTVGGGTDTDGTVGRTVGGGTDTDGTVGRTVGGGGGVPVTTSQDDVTPQDDDGGGGDGGGSGGGTLPDGIGTPPGSSTNNNDDTKDNSVDPVNPGPVDTHHAPDKWIVWVDYEDGKTPEDAKANLEESGLNIKVLDENRVDITGNIGGFALTKGGGPDSVQFNVPTDVVNVKDDGKETLYIVVTDKHGNQKTYTATFAETMEPDITLKPVGDPTSQDNPISN